MSRSRCVRAVAVSLLAVLPVLPVLVAAPASAHVHVTPSTTTADTTAVLEFAIGHGCDGSPTTSVEFRMPDGIYAVTPTRNPLWEVSLETEQVDPPVTDQHGTVISERVSSVVYRARTPLPDGQRDTFELSVRLPAEVGATVAFPTIQTCEQGESAWIEVPVDGQDPEELELPAPSLVVTAAESVAAPVAVPSDDSSGAPASLWLLAAAALGAGVLGAVLGLVGLVRQRRQS